LNKPFSWQRSWSAWLAFTQDRAYFTSMIRLALPIILQNFVMSALNMVGVMLIGQLGEVPVAAVGLSNQIFFLLNLLLFGTNSGAAMFTAQLWGQKDIPNIRRVLGLALILGLSGSLLFMIIAIFFPQVALGVYSKDDAVIAIGSSYLRIFGLSFVFIAISFCFASVLRSIGDVRTPLVVSISAISFNTLLSYALIFGKLGLPALGTNGAAWSICISRALECSALLWIIYWRKDPIAASPFQLIDFDLAFVKRILQRVLPVTINELFWSLGITTYAIVYARIGTDAIAAMNIVGTIDNLAFVTLVGIANACAILVGNAIGMNQAHKAYDYASRSLLLTIAGAILIGGGILLTARSLLSVYKVPPVVIQDAMKVLAILAGLLWVRAANTVIFLGALRSGGDTHYAFLIDVGTVWAVGVPMALLGAFVFHLPVYWVYLLVMSDEFSKWILGMFRFLSKKWINNLVEIV
jgi:putative MATE family efflux protein